MLGQAHEVLEWGYNIDFFSNEPTKLVDVLQLAEYRICNFGFPDCTKEEVDNIPVHTSGASGQERLNFYEELQRQCTHTVEERERDIQAHQLRCLCAPEVAEAASVPCASPRFRDLGHQSPDHDALKVRQSTHTTSIGRHQAEPRVGTAMMQGALVRMTRPR